MKILVFKDGSERDVTAENGKFWICGDEKFRKLSKQIEKVREAAPVSDAAQAAKPRQKKKAPKKKKATEDQEDGDCGR